MVLLRRFGFWPLTLDFLGGSDGGRPLHACFASQRDSVAFVVAGQGHSIHSGFHTGHTHFLTTRDGDWCLLTTSSMSHLMNSLICLFICLVRSSAETAAGLFVKTSVPSSAHSHSIFAKKAPSLIYTPTHPTASSSCHSTIVSSK